MTIIEFPKSKIVREIAGESEVVKEAKEKSKLNYADETIDVISANIVDSFEAFGLDVENDSFDKDMRFLHECLRALVYRNLDIPHHLHNFIDENVEVVSSEEYHELYKSDEEDEPTPA